MLRCVRDTRVGLLLCQNGEVKCNGPASQRPRSGDPFDNAQIAFHGIAEHFELRLIARAVMRGGRFIDAVEFDQHHALLDAFFVSLGSGAAGEETSAAGAYRGPGELGIFGERVRIRNREIGRNPITFAIVASLKLQLLCEAPKRLSGSAYERREGLLTLVSQAQRSMK
jgi:hypothetical protein